MNSVIVKLFPFVSAGCYFYARTAYAVPLTRILNGLDLTYPAHVHDMGCSFWDRVTDVFAFDARYVARRPSIVESRLRDNPMRAIMANLVKMPARLEGPLSAAGRKDRLWTFVGGWDVVLQWMSQ